MNQQIILDGHIINGQPLSTRLKSWTSAARIALRGDGSRVVSLDQVMRTMQQTGLDMQSKYKETSKGGLAIHITEC